MSNQFFTTMSQTAPGSEAAKFAFMMRRFLADVRTCTLAKVIAVTTDGEVAATGRVDLQPIVQQTDGAGNVIDLPTLYDVPYCRYQGGTDAVILDPKVGDVGVVIFGDRDLSSAIAAKDKSPPGSNRRNSLADALYLGSLLNGVPTQWVRFSTAGIEVHSPTKVIVTAPEIDYTADSQVNITAPNIKLDGAVHVTGAQTNDSGITASGDVTGSGTSLHTHKHGGVQTGGGQTSPPV